MNVSLSSPEEYLSTEESLCFQGSGDPAIELSDILHFSLTITLH